MQSTTVAILAVAAANAVVVLGGVSLWLGYRVRRAEHQPQPQQLGSALEARLAEISRTVDTIAVEEERIGEAQRYLLLQRQGMASSPGDTSASASRMNTPH